MSVQPHIFALKDTRFTKVLMRCRTALMQLSLGLVIEQLKVAEDYV